MDTKGNMGIQGTLGGGLTIQIPTEGRIEGMSVTLGGFTPSIYNLEGEGTNVGVSSLVPPILTVLGLDLNFFGNANEKPYEGYYGLTASVYLSLVC